MGKKKFIDKKNSATYHLFSRDSSDPKFTSSGDPNCSGYISSDRVFVRVDNSPYSADDFFADDDPDSIFADADAGEGSGGVGGGGGMTEAARRENLELGFPDDGYNYLKHMREIRNNGGGSVYYHNSKAKLDDLPNDVKAYDASRLEIARENDEPNENSIYAVASKTIGVKVQKAIDAEVAALLDDSDSSRFASDDEDLEEDFVVQANIPDEVDNDEFDKKMNLVENNGKSIIFNAKGNDVEFGGDFNGNDKPRVRRYLDDQFDMLENQEYGTDSEDEYDNFELEDEEEEEHVSLVEKLGPTFKDHVKEDFDIDGEYKAPADLLNEKDVSQNAEPVVSATVIIQRCKEYGEQYENVEENEDSFLEEESSDESEKWDCESIISTFSNLDNHPVKIETPNMRRNKKILENISEVTGVSSNIISLKGKARLPVDYLPNKGKKTVVEKVKEVDSLVKEQQKRKQHGQESKEEKKERKSAVKEERREARRVKKETKEIYKSEGHRAQKVAAFTGPSSIHLM